MNHVQLIGRLTKDPDVRYTESQMCIARYTLAVDRRGKDKGADFISCVAFGKSGEFAEKYLHRGTKIALTGRIQTGSYDGKNGKVYTTDIVVEEQEFCESKQTSQNADMKREDELDGFVNMPIEIEEELPFN